MRTVDARITAVEQSGTLSPSESLVASYELLSFAPYTSQINASLDTGTPQAYCARSGGQYAYAAFRLADGTSRLMVLRLATAGDWVLTGGAQVTANTVLVMRNGVFTDASNASWLYTAVVSGAAIQVQRQQIDGITSDPPTISLGNYGPIFGPTLMDTATLVRRVEAVCPTDNGVIVCVGTHDYTHALSTLQFWWIQDNTHVYQLDTIIQMALTEAYVNWYSAAKYATFVEAIYNPTTKAITVVVNAHPNGKAVQFAVTNGVESMLEVVVPVDPLYGSVYFRAASLAKIGGLYYLCGRLTFAYVDGTSDAYDCYLTSADAMQWSLGERSFYLTATACAGALLVDTAVAPVVIYYGGNLTVKVATATPAQGYNTGLQVNLTARLQPDWKLFQVSNGPNKFSGSLENSDGALTEDATIQSLKFTTISDNTAAFTMTVQKNGVQSMILDYGDGAQDNGLSFNHIYPAGGATRTLQLLRPLDGYQMITVLIVTTDKLNGSLPKLDRLTALTLLFCYGNQLSGSIPSLTANTALQSVNCGGNQLSGTIPPLAANTALTYFNCDGNQLSGTIPPLAANTALTYFNCSNNQLSGYTVGGLATQKLLSTFDASINQLPQAAVDAILHDFVTSLGITGRVVCNVNLVWGGNAAPSAAGANDKATLVAAGWTVTTN